MKIRLLLFLALCLLPSFVLAAEQEEPTIYVIKQGDTLWGISERFIKDPFYWPNMWSKNSQVTNPHFIYPGQKVRVFPDRLEIVPAETVLKSVPVEPLQEVAAEKSYTVYGTEGYLLEGDIKPLGTIIGIHNNRILAADDDSVYTDVGSIQGAKGGESTLFSVRTSRYFIPLPAK